MFSSLKALSIKGLAWSASESGFVALLTIGSYAVMARILAPEDFGVVALAMVFVFSSNLIVGHCFADAIIQRADLEPEHADTAFWANLAIALLLAGAVHLVAGHAAEWFGEPRLAAVLRWLSWAMPLTAIGAVQTAMLRRSLQFRTISVISVAARTAGVAVGVGMAVAGFGLWSLVGQQLVGIGCNGIAVAVASIWRPRLRFSLPHLQHLWRFGVHVSASQVVTGLGEQAMNLMIGSLFGSAVLGYFNIAWRITNLIRTLVGSAVYHVGFSAFARLQNDSAAVARALLQATRLSCLFGIPLGAGMVLLAEPMVFVLFGRTWTESVPLLAILAVQMLPAFYGMFFSACYRAMGRADWVLGLSLLYLVTGVAAVVGFAPLGVEAAAAAWVGRALLLLPVHIVLLRRMLGVPSRQLAAPILAPLCASVVMCVVLGPVLWRIDGAISDIVLLLSGIPAGVAVYLGAVFLFAPDLLRVAASTARIMARPAPVGAAARRE